MVSAGTFQYGNTLNRKIKEPRVETHSKTRTRIVRRYHPHHKQSRRRRANACALLFSRSLVCVTHHAVNKQGKHNTQIHTASKTQRNFFKLVLSSKHEKNVMEMFCTIQCTHSHRVNVLLHAHKQKISHTNSLNVSTERVVTHLLDHFLHNLSHTHTSKNPSD